MPTISNLTASNSSFIVQHGNYFDFNIFVLFLICTLGLLAYSAYIYKSNQSSGFIFSAIAILLAITATFGSLSVAHFSTVEGAVLAGNNTSVNQTITYSYIYPTQQVVASPILTVFCIILTIFAVLNCLFIFARILQGPEDNKHVVVQPMKPGEYILDGKRRKI